MMKEIEYLKIELEEQQINLKNQESHLPVVISRIKDLKIELKILQDISNQINSDLIKNKEKILTKYLLRARTLLQVLDSIEEIKSNIRELKRLLRFFEIKRVTEELKNPGETSNKEII